MISSMMWVRSVLSSASLHTVSNIAGPCSGAWRVVHSADMCCSRTVATRLTVLTAQSC
jgi:hypothetical protein